MRVFQRFTRPKARYLVSVNLTLQHNYSSTNKNDSESNSKEENRLGEFDVSFLDEKINQIDSRLQQQNLRGGKNNRDDDGDDDENHNSNREEHRLYSSVDDEIISLSRDANRSNTDETPNETTEEKLYRVLTSLRHTVQKELRAEVTRDSVEGVTAIPPLAPAGWAVQHTHGSRFFIMRKEIKAKQTKGNEHEDEEEEKEDDIPHFRSISDEMKGIKSWQQKKKERDQRRQDKSSQWVLTKGGKYQKGEAPKPFLMRSDVAITVYAPFKVQDLSLSDENNDIVEWSQFDVLIEKTCPSRRGQERGGGGAAVVDPGTQRIWDQQIGFYLQCASANNELRLRHAFFLCETLIRQLRERCQFGEGDNFYREVMDRIIGAEFDQQAAEGPSSRRRGAAQAGSELYPGRAATRQGTTRLYSPEGKRLRQGGVNGDYLRGLAYKGPYLTELSKELRDALLTYVMGDLGINAELVEYICQTQYFLEQEEYMGWLGSLDSFAMQLLQGAAVPR